MIPVGRTRLVAGLVYKKEIVSMGYCRMQSHPLQKQFARNEGSIYLHAEIDAIVNLLRHKPKQFLSSCSLYVVRLKWNCCDKDKLVDGLARPCQGCSRAIDHFKIPQVLWSEDSHVSKSIG